MELGVLPPWETFARGELKRRGVPASAVAVVEGESIDEWDDFRLLATWLKARPDATVAVASNPFSSRRVRYMLDAAMAPPEAAHARVFLLDDPQCTAANWRQSRFGVKHFMFSCLDLIYAWAHGSDRQTPPPQSVEAYQKALSERFGTRRQQNQHRTDANSLKGFTSGPPLPRGEGIDDGTVEKAGHLRILLVTNGYHTRRARWIFTEVLDGQAATVLPISVPRDEFAEESWWRSERGFAAIAGECLKLGFYRLRYGKLGCLAAGAALLWLGWRAFRRKPLVVNNLGVVV